MIQLVSVLAFAAILGLGITALVQLFRSEADAIVAALSGRPVIAHAPIPRRLAGAVRPSASRPAARSPLRAAA